MAGAGSAVVDTKKALCSLCLCGESSGVTPKGVTLIKQKKTGHLSVTGSFKVVHVLAPVWSHALFNFLSPPANARVHAERAKG